eukprot:9520986-Lingulodinium_polyedra.AAC.1
MDGATKDMLASMTYYSDHICGPLEALISCLHAKYFRDRYVETCERDCVAKFCVVVQGFSVEFGQAPVGQHCQSCKRGGAPEEYPAHDLGYEIVPIQGF